jgi:hypothetical protein
MKGCDITMLGKLLLTYAVMKGHPNYLTPFLAGYIVGQPFMDIEEIVSRLLVLCLLIVLWVLQLGYTAVESLRLDPSTAVFLYSFLLSVAPKEVLLASATLIAVFFVLLFLQPDEVEHGWMIQRRRRIRL